LLPLGKVDGLGIIGIGGGGGGGKGAVELLLVDSDVFRDVPHI